ncbi:MAG: hypothetical protein CM15mP23_22030 [Cryomorphaceae bacterium]|nr:MAG: hypothetical protein CM15mP23_22030 [Cryomorphaceae bacterium]
MYGQRSIFRECIWHWLRWTYFAFFSKKKTGMKTYMKLILSEWWSYNIKRYQIEIDGTCVFDDEAVQISFANGTNLETML